MDNQTQKLRFFLTTPHSCNYIEGEESTSLFADPIYPKSKPLYSLLVTNGFRRSGEHLYKPHCTSCHACVPVRIPVKDFKPRRQQKRILRKNRDLDVQLFQANFNEEHFHLYRDYLAARHRDGGMDNPSEDNYRDFLWSDWSDTWLYEFRLQGELMAVAVVDSLTDGQSAVYTFFSPEHHARSLGTYAILHLIEATRELGKSWLYLGYWIAQCDKMKYKTDFQPIECFRDNEWKRFDQDHSDSFAVDS